MADAADEVQAPEAMEEDIDNDDDGSDSDDDSDFEEVEVSTEDMALITKLEADLEANPNLYDLHLQVLNTSIGLSNKYALQDVHSTS